MFIGTHNKRAAEFLHFVGTGSCELNSDNQPSKRKNGLNMLPVCAYSATYHTLMIWYLKDYWLNEFPQQIP